MNKKLTILYAFTLAFASTPAFAQDCSKNSADSCQKIKQTAGTNPVPARAVETGTTAGLKMRASHAAEATQRANPKNAEAEPEKPVLRKVPAKEIGKNAVCPVTGEKMKVKADTVSASYKGKIYYFCCPGCDQSFLADPEKYAVKKAPAAAAKVYACPMGDYKGEKPGKCPKCGMTLEEKK